MPWGVCLPLFIVPFKESLARSSQKRLVSAELFSAKAWLLFSREAPLLSALRSHPYGHRYSIRPRLGEVAPAADTFEMGLKLLFAFCAEN